MPTPTSSPASRKPSAARSCLFAASLFVAYVFASVVLLLLPTGFIGPVIVVGGFVFVCVIGVHYFLWGRWLTRLLAEDARTKADPAEGPEPSEK